MQSLKKLLFDTMISFFFVWLLWQRRNAIGWWLFSSADSSEFCALKTRPFTLDWKKKKNLIMIKLNREWIFHFVLKWSWNHVHLCTTELKIIRIIIIHKCGTVRSKEKNHDSFMNCAVNWFSLLNKSVRCLFIYSFERSAFSSSFNHHCELWRLRPIFFSQLFCYVVLLSRFRIFNAIARWIFGARNL